jgi:hypothetical protein
MGQTLVVSGKGVGRPRTGDSAEVCNEVSQCLFGGLSRAMRPVIEREWESIPAMVAATIKRWWAVAWQRREVEHFD